MHQITHARTDKVKRTKEIGGVGCWKQHATRSAPLHHHSQPPPACFGYMCFTAHTHTKWLRSCTRACCVHVRIYVYLGDVAILCILSRSFFKSLALQPDQIKSIQARICQMFSLSLPQVQKPFIEHTQNHAHIDTETQTRTPHAGTISDEILRLALFILYLSSHAHTRTHIRISTFSPTSTRRHIHIREYLCKAHANSHTSERRHAHANAQMQWHTRTHLHSSRRKATGPRSESPKHAPASCICVQFHMGA